MLHAVKKRGLTSCGMNYEGGRQGRPTLLSIGMHQASSVVSKSKQVIPYYFSIENVKSR